MTAVLVFLIVELGSLAIVWLDDYLSGMRKAKTSSCEVESKYFNPYTYNYLGYWIWENMPELDKEIGAMRSKDEVRLKLNEVTGLSICANEAIKDTAPLFLDALRKIRDGNK